MPFVNPARRLALVLGALALCLTAVPRAAVAEVGEIRMSKQHGLPYLPFLVMERFGLVEKAASSMGLDLKASWRTLANSSAMMDVILSGQMDVITPGVPTLAIMWDKTVGTRNEMRALSAIQSMPYVLVTRNPEINTVRDYTPKDRIALPAVKLTGHAIVLQMAAAREWGRENYDRLDTLTVSRSHPDAATALLSGNSEITSHFASSPFYYFELADPKIHKVLHSYELTGGKHTNGVMMTSKRFYEANPKTCAALLAALEEADAFIKANPREAAQIYIDMTNETRSSLDEIEKMVADPDVEYTTVPMKVMSFVEFMNLAGTVKNRPSSWKDLFFPTAHNLPGS